jgi:hypothetical protein
MQVPPFGPTPIAQPSFGLSANSCLPRGAIQSSAPSHRALATTALWQHGLQRIFYPTAKRSLACLDAEVPETNVRQPWQQASQESTHVTRMLQPGHAIHKSRAMPSCLDERLTGPSMPVGVTRRYGPGWHALRTCFAARLSNGPVYGKPEAVEVCTMCSYMVAMLFVSRLLILTHLVAGIAQAAA